MTEWSIAPVHHVLFPEGAAVAAIGACLALRRRWRARGGGG